ncbi:FAS1 domain-containing protein [Helicostylum pulchrum]|uniref:FAS1 domain-containing protein n=1 Tax=Helicostylum pulchrum TaxID=562976 RepID=A0ABP9YAB0_9FUNG|nr:FAS1 domain-containing protein [Helicostylum pulchrum]
MQIGKYLSLALLGATAVAAQTQNQTQTDNNSTIYDLLSAPNNNLNASRFVGLVNSDPGYQPIVNLLKNPGNLTCFVPSDGVLNKVLMVWKAYAKQHKINVTGDYPPANMSYNNYTVSDLITYHIVGDRVNLTNLTEHNISVSVVHSVLNDSKVDHLGTGLPILIGNNASYAEFHNQTWMKANSSYLEYEVGNGHDDTDVDIKDVNATNGLINIISSVLIPPMSPTTVIKEVDDIDGFEELLKKYPIIGNTLNSTTNFTLFAPASDALKKANLTGMNNDTIQALVRSHLVEGVYYTPNITANALTNDGQTNFTTFSNITFPAYFNSTSGYITLNNTARIVDSNIFFNNGVMHVVDSIITNDTEHDHDD